MSEQSGTIGCITVTADIITLASPALPGAGDKAIVLTLTDNALAFNPLSLPGPDLALGLEERSIGGWGFTLFDNWPMTLPTNATNPLDPVNFLAPARAGKTPAPKAIGCESPSAYRCIRQSMAQSSLAIEPSL